MAGDFNTPLTTMDRSSRHRINKETRALNDTLDQMDLTDRVRTLPSKTTEYSLFSSAHGTFCKIDRILAHKTALNKYKRLEIIPSTLSDHKAMTLDINHRKKSRKPPKAWTLKNTQLKNESVNQVIGEGMKKYMGGAWVAQSVKRPTSARSRSRGP